MADQVHPNNSDSPPPANPDPENPPKRPTPKPGTYVIAVPKDQIYRVPSAEEARRYEHLSRRKPRRNPCCRCLCYLISFILVLAILLAAAAGIFYLVFKPQSPKYTVSSFAVKGLNLTSTSPISPEFDITVDANNPNDKIGMYYGEKSALNVYYKGVKFADGVLPAFFQTKNNVTVIKTILKGDKVELSAALATEMVNSQRGGSVPFKFNLRVPVKFKVGSVKTWEITVKVNCDIKVDKLTPLAKIVAKDCSYGVNIW